MLAETAGLVGEKIALLLALMGTGSMTNFIGDVPLSVQARDKGDVSVEGNVVRPSWCEIDTEVRSANAAASEPGTASSVAACTGGGGGDLDRLLDSCKTDRA